ncbi:hypothetical protein D9619_001634 [Psilocybe cf. subviscida]|uniref:Hydrophobin n=1 Tax=Psilocybe cf. subviscida TaxID=2480587 RepID=A0A8H5F368_9AGAR|nr:hypothetical protein D9619_001634 [Psilocybe cf. subviscida]
MLLQSSFKMRFAAATLLSLPIFAAATAIDVSARQNSCSGGSMTCCNSTQESTALNLGSLSGLLGIQLPNLGALIGLTCTSLSILSALGQSWLEDLDIKKTSLTNHQLDPAGLLLKQLNGLIALGCIAINL